MTPLRTGPDAGTAVRGCPSGMGVLPDPAILADGWEPRFVADAARHREAAALYADLGFEVLSIALQLADFGAECGGCAAGCPEFSMLYTRRRPVPVPGGG